MSKVPSKLYRRLSPTLTTPIFYVQIGGVFYRDSDIVSIKIVHGSEGHEPTFAPTRCEVHLKGKLPIVNGQNLYVIVTSSELDDPNEYSLDWRFSGRVSTQTVHTDPKNPTTVIQASSWLALALQSNLDWPVGADWGLRTVAGDLVSKLQRMFPDEIAWIEPHFQDSDKLYETRTDSLNTGMRKYLTDIGVYCFILRQGWFKFRQPDKLLTEHDECVAGPGGPFPRPIEYHQASAPMDLEQTVENPYVGTKIKRRDVFGNLVEGVWSFGQNWEDTGVQPSEYVTFDWSHIKYEDDRLYRPAINAESHRLFRVTWASPRVQFDLIRLLSSANSRDVDAAKAALRIELGDWIPFGRDWPRDYRGAKLVTGFTETVTPDEWTIELSVHGPQQITGAYRTTNDEPKITGYPWDRYDRTTDSYPNTTTADLSGTYTWQYDDIEA